MGQRAELCAMENTTVVTLVIGTYNPHKEWFENALKSAEGLFDDIIIVDDGSTEPVENATVTHETNKGFYQARNTGITHAKDGWIASLDDDDEFIPENVLLLKRFAEQSKADIIHFPIEMFGDMNCVWGHSPNMENILNGNQIPSGSWFRKSLWEKLSGFQYPLAEDWDFWARAWKSGATFDFFPLPIYPHRMRKDSLSHGWTGETFINIRNEIRNRYDAY